MTYSEEEIQKYLSILQNFKDGLDVYSVRDKHIPPKIPQKVSCNNCGNTHFFKDKGFRYCKKCFYSLGRVFIRDFTSKDHYYFQKKSIYKREYHYQNKIEEISKKFDLVIRPEVYYKLKLDLQKTDKVIDNINEKWKRKRLINITYLIKRVLSEYDKSEADKIQLNLSEKTLKFYDEWYDSYYYQNKIEEISKKCNLEITTEVYHKLRLKLQKVIEKVNEKYGRKRMINISYVIKRVLRKYDKMQADKIQEDKLQLNLSDKSIIFI